MLANPRGRRDFASALDARGSRGDDAALFTAILSASIKKMRDQQ
jgi:hypothetical protein